MIQNLNLRSQDTIEITIQPWDHKNELTIQDNAGSFSVEGKIIGTCNYSSPIEHKIYYSEELIRYLRKFIRDLYLFEIRKYMDGAILNLFFGPYEFYVLKWSKSVGGNKGLHEVSIYKEGEQILKEGGLDGHKIAELINKCSEGK